MLAEIAYHFVRCLKILWDASITQAINLLRFYALNWRSTYVCFHLMAVPMMTKRRYTTKKQFIATSPAFSHFIQRLLLQSYEIKTADPIIFQKFYNNDLQRRCAIGARPSPSPPPIKKINFNFYEKSFQLRSEKFSAFSTTKFLSIMGNGVNSSFRFITQWSSKLFNLQPQS